MAQEVPRLKMEYIKHFRTKPEDCRLNAAKKQSREHGWHFHNANAQVGKRALGLPVLRVGESGSPNIFLLDHEQNVSLLVGNFIGNEVIQSARIKHAPM